MKQILNVVLLVACLYAVVPAIILTIDHFMDSNNSIVNKIADNIRG